MLVNCYIMRFSLSTRGPTCQRLPSRSVAAAACHNRINCLFAHTWWYLYLDNLPEMPKTSRVVFCWVHCIEIFHWVNGVDAFIRIITLIFTALIVFWHYKGIWFALKGWDLTSLLPVSMKDRFMLTWTVVLKGDKGVWWRFISTGLGVRWQSEGI